MPELPDVTVYIERLADRALSQPLQASWPGHIDDLGRDQSLRRCESRV